jgi:hypothetical protein
VPINAACNICGKSYVLDDGVLGKKVRCKSCGNPFVVASAAARSNPATPPSPAARASAPGNDLYANLASAAHAESRVKPAPDDDVGEYDLRPTPNDVRPQYSEAQCPSCRNPLPGHQQICMNCNYDKRTGMRATAQRPQQNRPMAARSNRSERDRDGFTVLREFKNPGVQMIESILLKGATVFVSVGTFFLAVVLPLYVVISYGRALKNMDEAAASMYPSVGAVMGRMVVMGLATALGLGCAYVGMLMGTRVGAMVRRCQLPDNGFARLNVTLMSAWLIFMALIFVNVGLSRRGGAGIDPGFMGFMTVFFGSFFMWVGWLGGAVVGAIGTANAGFPLAGIAGIAVLSIVGFIGTLVMFPVYWFIHRFRIIDALVCYAFMCLGYIVGSGIGGILMYLVLQLLPDAPKPTGPFR